MYRVLFAAITLFTFPAAFGQAPPAQQSPAHILIKAKCALADGTVVGQKLVEVAATLSPEEKRAVAEKACQPILATVSAECDDLSNRVETMRSEWRIAPLHGNRERELKVAIKQALAAAPLYCKVTYSTAAVGR